MVLDQCPFPPIDIIYADLEKTFDKSNHNKLLSKLSALGFSDVLLQLLSSYLWQREYYVVFWGAKSEVFYGPSGVPQGAVLRSYLFTLYAALPLSSVCCDDIKIYKEIAHMKDRDLSIL